MVLICKLLTSDSHFALVIEGEVIAECMMLSFLFEISVILFFCSSNCLCNYGFTKLYYNYNHYLFFYILRILQFFFFQIWAFLFISGIPFLQIFLHFTDVLDCLFVLIFPIALNKKN
ncbi:unnamed protein product [Cuscuta epithymum]|uniref:Uncharacterized protein n=1 Tax=Cuscuta epithymum TaxID=186058 RepID=A0AAV0DGS0_9ASTE|nr:unnamed protein product [Cuscuta epithymum]